MANAIDSYVLQGWLGMAPAKKRFLKYQVSVWSVVTIFGLTVTYFLWSDASNSVVAQQKSSNGKADPAAPVLTRAQFEARKTQLEEAATGEPRTSTPTPTPTPTPAGSNPHGTVKSHGAINPYDGEPYGPWAPGAQGKPHSGNPHGGNPHGGNPHAGNQHGNPHAGNQHGGNSHGALRNGKTGISPYAFNPHKNFHGDPEVRQAALQVDGEDVEDTRPSWMDQTGEEAMAKSFGCLKCHQGVEKMHKSESVKLGCVDCHGGDPAAETKECAHVLPRFPERWIGAANPQRTFALLNLESPEFVRFINPGDWRAVDTTCGTARCHEDIAKDNKKSMMGHSAMVPGSALYNNGSVPNKVYRYGESYGWGGKPQRLFSTPRPSLEDVHVRGVLPWIDPLPRYEATQPGNIFRVLEIDNNATSKRGPGTDARTDAVFLNLVKTKLNDPTMVFLGTNDNPGDYRSSGCSSCHVLYANDRDPDHSGAIAVYGNHGMSASADPTIPEGEPGHPIKHSLTRQIPSSQCLTCHFHQGSGALANYYGYMWWDYESDADSIYSRYGMPKGGGYIGYKGNEAMHELAPEVNPEVKGNKFADFHNAGWIMQAVMKRNKKGHLIDKDDMVIDSNDPDWHNKAVHLSDIHMTKGMHCIDCHFKQDSHGDGRIYGEMINAVEINCNDCHGTVNDVANLITSNHPGGNNLLDYLVPWVDEETGKRPSRFEWTKEGKLLQRSMVTPGLKWEVKQVKNVIDPEHEHYSKDAHYAKTIQKDGHTWGVVEEDPSDCDRAHTSDAMTCYACHSSWNSTCAGCHLEATTNIRKEVLHYEGGFTKTYAAYNPQVLRSDGFLLGLSGTVKGNKITPVRGASGVVVSASAGNRQMVLHQQPTISAEGHSGHAFSPNPPHTVGPHGTVKKCSACHISDKGDNNMSAGGVLGLGNNAATFMGRYVYVAEATGGIQAIRVTAGETFPKPVIGSNMQRLVDPIGFTAHYNNGAKLMEGYGHKAKNTRSIWHMGEWLLTADGPGGFKAYDIANIHNKDVAQKIVTSLISPLGQRQYVSTRNATCVATATVLPTDPNRSHRPENQEQPIPKHFQFAFITDYVEGLIMVDISTLFDGVPTNNYFERTTTFNPNGILCGAKWVRIWGEYAYVLTRNNGLVIVNIKDPCNPKIASVLDDPEICDPRSIAFQFRYAFITDCEGVKIVDITSPETPRLAASIPMNDARDITIMRSYAYIAAGADGLAVLDIERVEEPGEMRYFTAGGCINDASAVQCAATYGSLFCYVGDGVNGLRVIQLISPADGDHSKGISPDPFPRLIGTYCDNKGPIVNIAPGMPRDRFVDIDGNQIGVFGRLGARPFNRKEQHRMYRRNGQIYTVSDEPIDSGYIGKPPKKPEIADRPKSRVSKLPPIQGPATDSPQY